MKFVHDDPDFAGLVLAVASKRQIAPDLVEKDYWVTHALWALHRAGLEVWFKGGTSLSKGFGLIERFSEDLDLRVEPGRSALPSVRSWTSTGPPAVRDRRVRFEALSSLLQVPGAKVELVPDPPDPSWRSAEIRVIFPAHHRAALGGLLRPFVLLEVGDARVTPFVPRDLSSFVHEELATLGQSSAFEDNTPRSVRCVHPLVTLLEKIDALQRRVPRSELAAPAFVRHYEDASRIIGAEHRLPPLEGYATVRLLAEEMHASRQLASLPDAASTAFTLAPGRRSDEIRAASDAIAPMFWGPRGTLEEACVRIARWISREFG